MTQSGDRGRAPQPARPPSDATTVTAIERCPRCGWIHMPGDRFCEQCSYDFSVGPAASSPACTRWTATVAADRGYFDQLEATGFLFPDDVPVRIVPLDADEVLVGRRSREHGIEPDIDLSGEHGDPAVSRRHARLLRKEDGAYWIEDLASVNGTWVNDAPVPIEPGVPVRLAAGDRVHLGAWTTITLTCE